MGVSMENSIYEYDPTKAERKALGYDISEKIRRQVERDKINRELSIGTVVFFVDYMSGVHGIERFINFGTIEHHYPGAVNIALYDAPKRRAIDGVPIDEMEFPTPFKKLPKSWTYNTELYKVTYIPLPPDVIEEAKHLSMRKAEDIKRAIEIGCLVNRWDIDYRDIESNISKGDGWQIVMKSNTSTEPLRNITKATYEIYQTYEEAEEAILEEIRQLQIESDMSDEEWSIYQIDRTLSKISMPENIREKYRDFILSLDKIEDVAIRLSGGAIQWKYDKNKKWNNIVIN